MPLDPTLAIVSKRQAESYGHDRTTRPRPSRVRTAGVGDAYTDLSTADREGSLEPADLMQLATAAALIGYDNECAELWERAHQAALRMDDPPRAARCAFWLGMTLRNKGELARAGGWLARGRRLLDERQQDCVERGYLLIPAAQLSVAQGDAAAAAVAFEQADEIGQRFGDVDLITLARLGRGLARVHLGAAAEAVTSLDEVMVAVEAREVSPLVSGIVYCAVIGVCHRMFDSRRAQEWTAGLNRWCASQPDLVPFRGECQGAPCGNPEASWFLARCHGRSPACVPPGLQAGSPPSHRSGVLSGGRAAPLAGEVLEGRRGISPGEPVGIFARARSRTVATGPEASRYRRGVYRTRVGGDARSRGSLPASTSLR
jgi:hypothetical protein